MKIFLSEFICGGGLVGEPLPDSMRREGLAMLAATAMDFARLPGVTVTTTIDHRLMRDATQSLPRAIESFPIRSRSEERRRFDRLCRSSDRVLVIAPETKGILERRVRSASARCCRMLNGSPAAISLCGDKLRLADHLTSHSIPTIPTQAVKRYSPFSSENRVTPLVVKPRDGAGSSLTFLVDRSDSPGNRFRMIREIRRARSSSQMIVQPFVSGTALSVAILVHATDRFDLFPVARQDIRGPQFRYHGGSIPADIPPVLRDAVWELVRRAVMSIPGLHGYIGCDVLVPDESPTKPLLVEINPRLTTSYVGYRQLSRNNLAGRWLDPENVPLEWNDSPIHFDAAGRLLGVCPVTR